MIVSIIIVIMESNPTMSYNMFVLHATDMSLSWYACHLRPSCVVASLSPTKSSAAAECCVSPSQSKRKHLLQMFKSSGLEYNNMLQSFTISIIAWKWPSPSTSIDVRCPWIRSSPPISFKKRALEIFASSSTPSSADIVPRATVADSCPISCRRQQRAKMLKLRLQGLPLSQSQACLHFA